jgi:replicative DNA helicase
MANTERRRMRPRLSMSGMTNAIEYICNDLTISKWKPKAIFLDYLQRIKPDPEDGRDRRIQMMNIVDRSKDLAISFDCPVYLGVQAGRQVDERADKIPNMSDGQETSNIEQSSDKVYTVWYPIKTEDEGSYLNGYEVTKHLWVLNLAKQKLGESNKLFRLYTDPERNFFGELAAPNYAK